MQLAPAHRRLARRLGAVLVAFALGFGMPVATALAVLQPALGAMDEEHHAEETHETVKKVAPAGGTRLGERRSRHVRGPQPPRSLDPSRVRDACDVRRSLKAARRLLASPGDDPDDAHLA